MARVRFDAGGSGSARNMDVDRAGRRVARTRSRALRIDHVGAAAVRERYVLVVLGEWLSRAAGDGQLRGPELAGIAGVAGRQQQWYERTWRDPTARRRRHRRAIGKRRTVIRSRRRGVGAARG